MKKLLSISLGIFLTVLFFGCAPKPVQTIDSSAPGKNKDLYIQLYSVRDDINKNFTTTIEQLAAMGYTGIEAANYNNGKFYGLTPAEFKTAIEKAGMKVLSSHTGKALPENIANANWTEIWQWWDKCIADHKAAGMKFIVTPSMPTPKTLADLKKYCDYYNQIGERCKKAGIKYGYHNHAFEFKEIEGQKMYDYMIQNTDPSKVFFEMDVYWTTKGGQNPVAYFNKYPGRFTILHIKDEKELGESGIVNFDNIFQNAAKAGMKYIMVEVEQYNFAPLESVKRSYDYLITNKNVRSTYSR